MVKTKRFRVTLGNNTVRLVDFEENKQLMSISFKKHNDAIDCQNALKFQCDLLNDLNDENHQLKRQIGNLEHTRDFCAECCERLEKENDELKSKIRKVESDYVQLWMHNYK